MKGGVSYDPNEVQGGKHVGELEDVAFTLTTMFCKATVNDKRRVNAKRPRIVRTLYDRGEINLTLLARKRSKHY